MNEAKYYGKVKWFDPERSYGFITADSGEHVFAHYSEILVDGYKSLEQGQTVAFKLTKTSKGWNAEAIEIIEEVANA